MATADTAARNAIVIGGGPAGLMAAEMLAGAGRAVDLYDAMPSVGRKFLLAGKGGLNLTHSEPFDAFVARYGSRRDRLEPMLRDFGPDQLREWARGLGIETFVGTSGRVFPVDLKAAPLLRHWLHRLREQGVRFHMRHRWLGWDEGETQGTGAWRFATPGAEVRVRARAAVLALGGGSWPRLGSDGSWVPLLAKRGVAIERLQPSNCGFDVDAAGGWSEHFRSRFAGQPLKNVALALEGGGFAQAGEFVVTETGVEGSLVYAASSAVRERIAATGRAVVLIDLLPQRSAGFVADEVARPRGSRSLSTHLKSRLGIDGVKAALLHELLPREVFADTARLAAAIKALPLALARPRPLAEAISSAGGVSFTAMNEQLMLTALPGVFCAGEMLDWEAPTGGYLLTACFASGVVAGRAAAQHTG
ncbi:3-dehydro-bile acid delta(4,6)-reductase [Burkholderiaceae bacterium]|nr:3-dehydro-bile acid delta(4,6)-reductase [Burkholderiaceae bacterium]